MATVIDALIVTLGIDASAFKKGQQETQDALKSTEAAATRTAKTMQAEGGRASEFFTAAKVEALALLGVLTGGAGLIAGFKDVATGLNEIKRASLLSGVDTQWMQAFGAAIGRTGGNIAGANQQLISFANTVTEFRLRGGAPGLAQYSQILGIDPTKATPQEVIAGIMRMIEANGTSAQGRLASTNAMGRMGVGADLQASLLQIGTLANLQAAIQQSIKLGAVQTKEQIEEAAHFNSSVEAFGQAVKGFEKAMIPFKFLATHLDQITENYFVKPGSVTKTRGRSRHADRPFRPKPYSSQSRRVWQMARQALAVMGAKRIGTIGRYRASR